MAQQLFSPPVGPPPSSRWEGGGYHSDSSRSVSDDKCLQTTTIILPNIIEGNYINNNNHNYINNNISIQPPSLHIKKHDIPPPPQMNLQRYNHYNLHQPMHTQPQQVQTQTQINNNNNISNSNSNSSAQSLVYNNNNSSQPKTPISKSIPLHTNGLIQISTADSIAEMDHMNAPSSCNINIIQQGEIDDGIDALSIDVDHINIEECITDQIHNDIEEKEINKLNKYNQNINMLFGNKLIRSLYMNATLFFFCILSFPLWFGDVAGIDNKTDNDVTNAYILAAFSMFVTFIASGFGLIFGIFDIFDMELPFKKTARNVTIIFYLVGGFFYFIAACNYANFYNTLGILLQQDLSGFGGICFGEMFYISVYIIMLAIDFWKPFLNRMDHRIYLFFTLYLFCALILMFSYLICSDKFNGNYGFIGIGVIYVFGFIIAIVFLVMSIASNIITNEFVIKPKLDEIKPKLDLISSVLMFVFMLCTVIAYWATERIRDAEKVYYVGFGIFMLSNGVLMTFDMRFSLYLTKFIDDE